MQQRRSFGHGRSIVLAAIVGPLIFGLALTNPSTAQQPPPLDAQRIIADSGFHGGLIVHAGLENASLPLSLSKSPNVLVHGLVRDHETLDTVRTQIRDADAYGRVSATLWQSPYLPYADAMVNLLLVLNEGALVDQTEVDRVLAPHGVAWVRRDGALEMYRKPRPADIDEWSHTRYDSTGNAASKDQRVGPPRHLQWEATPRWNRGVKTSSLVSAQGRIFFILDDSHFASSERTWSLIARDAYNGIQLWRRVLPSWGGARGGKKVGPAQVGRRLVAVGDKVYATLGEFAPVSVLNAATGESIRLLSDTAQAEEFIVSNGVLVVLLNPNTPAGIRRGQHESMHVVAVNPETGLLLWKHPAEMVLPLTLAADAQQVVYHDGKVIKSFDLKSGMPRWTSPPTGQKIGYRDKANPDSPGAEKSTILLAPQFAPTLIVYEDVVAFAGGRQINVLSAQDGRELWRADYAPSNYSVPVDLFGFNGHLWGPDPEMNLWRPLDDNIDFNAYDPLTGVVNKRLTGKYGFRFQHHRCHQMKVVGNSVLAARAGIEFLDTDTGAVAAHHWVRGSCFYGIMPANGLLYAPPHDCACYIRAKLSGLMALNAAPGSRPSPNPKDRTLVRGPAYGKAPADPKGDASGDWPTYRHDRARSGRSALKIDPELLLGWSTQLTGPLTSPVVANNRLYVASVDAHRLHALDATSGDILWQYSFDARVDSPPTLHEGLVLCGCRDGSVHALRASDGALVWRFLACPEERLIVSRGQVESVWPVNGSVLVLDNTAYFTAGRSSYLDGGIRFYGLDASTGRAVVDTVLNTLRQDGSELLDDQGVDGFMGGILSSDGERIFLRHNVLDRSGNLQPDTVPHLHGPDGFLSADTTTRLLWTYAPMYTSPHQGAFYDRRLSRTLFPSGRILVEDDDVIYGFGRNHYDKPRPDSGGTWALFAAPKKSDVPLDLSATEYLKRARNGELSIDFEWWKKLRIQAWAMVKTEDLLFVAGPVGTDVTSQAALDGNAPGMLVAVSPDDGRVLAEMTLPAPPAWDGMAAASGNLYLTLKNGQVVCLWSAASGRPGTPLSPAAWRAQLPALTIEEEPGLLGHWRFDEGVGMLARDCSGRGHDAEVSGQWRTDDRGVCLASNGAPNAALIPDAPHLQFGNDDFTLALWVKVADHGARLLGKEAFPEDWWVVNLLDSGHAELVLGEGRGPRQSVRAETASPVPAGVWNHLAAVVDRQAREVRWYLNGALDSREAIPETMKQGLNADGRDIAIPSAHMPFRGSIGDFRIYGEAITAERVGELFEEGP
ncbi:MAG: PQQ-binding-like beta-propeller repeat protein [bacterium]|nr:PQQ-binding-like beta-propeller repeat protein [bacterium]